MARRGVRPRYGSPWGCTRACRGAVLAGPGAHHRPIRCCGRGDDPIGGGAVVLVAPAAATAPATAPPTSNSVSRPPEVPPAPVAAPPAGTAPEPVPPPLAPSQVLWFFDEVLIPIAKKDESNASAPSSDQKVRRPGFAPRAGQAAPGPLPGVFPNLAAYTKPRADLAAILVIGIPKGFTASRHCTFTFTASYRWLLAPTAAALVLLAGLILFTPTRSAPTLATEAPPLGVRDRRPPSTSCEDTANSCFRGNEDRACRGTRHTAAVIPHPTCPRW